ncbi:Glycine--tRNA ligase beta subunit [Candidatus Sulfotelmatomonas gaucii]|uniref:Glycine--tRNA ligase beta subunit n=1 Tax=Candidatus Sulfuritelmatomonas gaucii TaxID=2043161 RepID=A0A2N9L1X6_9BACT|nr:Glycine--tRNA ligase beta subunit [Candidatus Sulfotelmatomonas gaucii]
MSDFLLEIGLEEVPARMIAGAEAELGKRVSDLLKRERLVAPEAKLTTYSTPRRLAVLAEGVLARQADAEKVVMGPSWKVAFKDGTPTAVAEAFAKKAGATVADLKKVETSRGEYVGASVKQTGRTASEILMAELPKEVLAVYWAKNMYWRAGKPERFVRPVRWVVALMDSNVVPVEIAGITAGNASRGHRVLHGDVPVVIDQARNYAKSLLDAAVVADVAERRQFIRKALDAATRTIPGARWREDEPLVETVVHLTEWPTVIVGDFEPEYLDLPEEVLVTVMRDHQKYFAMEDAEVKSDTASKLLPHFLAVLNTQTDEEGAAIIRHGNARVLRARFKDARFFWDFDQKTPLADRFESLKNVTFQKELGSYYWKTEQNLAVATALAAEARVGDAAFDEAALFKAVALARTDLTTELVKEFTELQGIIGGLYARAQGLGETVAKAIYDQYTPASIEDAIPSTVEGQLLGLADRVQTIVAMFGIGNAPTGSKDPFALRRAANAIVKILAESGLPLTLEDVIKASGVNDAGKTQVSDFFRERLQFYLKDVRGFTYDMVNAVLAVGADDVRDTIARAEALAAVRGSADFLAVSAAFKRIKNILRQAEEKGYQPSQPKLAQLALEAIDLWDRSKELAPQIANLREQRAYREALAQIATLRPTVDAFFDKVMVLDADETVRSSNLGLIEQVLKNFSTMADFSEIVTG